VAQSGDIRGLFTLADVIAADTPCLSAFRARVSSFLACFGLRLAACSTNLVA